MISLRAALSGIVFAILLSSSSGSLAAPPPEPPEGTKLYDLDELNRLSLKALKATLVEESKFTIVDGGRNLDGGWVQDFAFWGQPRKSISTLCEVDALHVELSPIPSNRSPLKGWIAERYEQTHYREPPRGTPCNALRGRDGFFTAQSAEVAKAGLDGLAKALTLDRGRVAGRLITSHSLSDPAAGLLKLKELQVSNISVYGDRTRLTFVDLAEPNMLWQLELRVQAGRLTAVTVDHMNLPL